MSLIERMAEIMAQDEYRFYVNDKGLYDRKARRWLFALLQDEGVPDEAIVWLREELRQHLINVAPAGRVP